MVSVFARGELTITGLASDEKDDRSGVTAAIVYRTSLDQLLGLTTLPNHCFHCLLSSVVFPVSHTDLQLHLFPISILLIPEPSSLLFFVVEPVCLSVTDKLQIDSSFLFLDGIEPFFGRQFSMWHSK